MFGWGGCTYVLIVDTVPGTVWLLWPGKKDKNMNLHKYITPRKRERKNEPITAVGFLNHRNAAHCASLQAGAL